VLLLFAGLASFALGDWLVAVQAGALVNQAQESVTSSPA
jgi:hypothetical protein